jgi:hypothetical protein
VVPDVHYEEVGEDTDQSRLNVYVPYARSGSRSMALLVRAHGSPSELITPMREAMRRIGPTFPVFGLLPMTEMRQRTTWEQEFFGEMMAGFAAAARARSACGWRSARVRLTWCRCCYVRLRRSASPGS